MPSHPQEATQEPVVEAKSQEIGAQEAMVDDPAWAQEPPFAAAESLAKVVCAKTEQEILNGLIQACAPLNLEEKALDNEQQKPFVALQQFLNDAQRLTTLDFSGKVTANGETKAITGWLVQFAVTGKEEVKQAPYLTVIRIAPSLNALKIDLNTHAVGSLTALECLTAATDPALSPYLLQETLEMATAQEIKDWDFNVVAKEEGYQGHTPVWEICAGDPSFITTILDKEPRQEMSAIVKKWNFNAKSQEPATKDQSAWWALFYSICKQFLKFKKELQNEKSSFEVRYEKTLEESAKLMLFQARITPLFPEGTLDSKTKISWINSKGVAQEASVDDFFKIIMFLPPKPKPVSVTDPASYPAVPSDEPTNTALPTLPRSPAKNPAMPPVSKPLLTKSPVASSGIPPRRLPAPRVVKTLAERQKEIEERKKRIQAEKWFFERAKDNLVEHWEAFVQMTYKEWAIKFGPPLLGVGVVTGIWGFGIASAFTISLTLGAGFTLYAGYQYRDSLKAAGTWSLKKAKGLWEKIRPAKANEPTEANKKKAEEEQAEKAKKAAQEQAAIVKKEQEEKPETQADGLEGEKLLEELAELEKQDQAKKDLQVQEAQKKQEREEQAVKEKKKEEPEEKEEKSKEKTWQDVLNKLKDLHYGQNNKIIKRLFQYRTQAEQAQENKSKKKGVKAPRVMEPQKAVSWIFRKLEKAEENHPTRKEQDIYLTKRGEVGPQKNSKYFK